MDYLKKNFGPNGFELPFNEFNWNGFIKSIWSFYRFINQDYSIRDTGGLQCIQSLGQYQLESWPYDEENASRSEDDSDALENPETAAAMVFKAMNESKLIFMFPFTEPFSEVLEDGQVQGADLRGHNIDDEMEEETFYGILVSLSGPVNGLRIHFRRVEAEVASDSIRLVFRPTPFDEPILAYLKSFAKPTGKPLA
jgi:hypothetical protein